MRERFKTVVLTLLVALSMVQFILLIASGQEPVRVLSPTVTTQVIETQDLVPPDILAAPLRMIAHEPGREQPHALLRSNSGFFANIWNLAKGVFSASALLDGTQIEEVSANLWNPNQASIELILSQQLPLAIYLDLLGVSIENDDAYIVDRFYLSAVEDDLILFSDGTGGVYTLPWKMKAEVLRAFLAVMPKRGLITVQPMNIASFGLRAVHTIYTIETNNASQWSVVPALEATRFEQQARLAFSDLTSLRISQDSVTGDMVFEDFERRLRYTGNMLLLEQTRGSLISTEDSATIWGETVQFMRSVDLWPEDSFYFDGIYDTGTRQILFLQQAKDGRPVFYWEQNEDGERLVSSLRALSRNGDLVSLRYRPLRFVNIIGNIPAISQEQLLQRFVANLAELPNTADGLPLLRDIYEGFLCDSQSETTQLVWVIEFVDGRRYFFDMLTGAYQGCLPAVSDRY